MSFIFVASAVVGIGATVAGSVMQYQSASAAEKNAEAQAKFDKASTEKRLKEERARTSENLLRAEEEKSKELSKQRAAFVKAGVLPSSPSADLVIGKLGENLQTRISDMFTQANDNMSSIQASGSARYFNSMQNASAASRQKAGAFISGATSLSTKALKGYQDGSWNSLYDYTKK